MDIQNVPAEVICSNRDSLSIIDNASFKASSDAKVRYTHKNVKFIARDTKSDSTKTSIKAALKRKSTANSLAISFIEKARKNHIEVYGKPKTNIVGQALNAGKSFAKDVVAKQVVEETQQAVSLIGGLFRGLGKFVPKGSNEVGFVQSLSSGINRMFAHLFSSITSSKYWTGFVAGFIAGMSTENFSWRYHNQSAYQRLCRAEKALSPVVYEINATAYEDKVLVAKELAEDLSKRLDAANEAREQILTTSRRETEAILASWEAFNKTLEKTRSEEAIEKAVALTEFTNMKQILGDKTQELSLAQSKLSACTHTLAKIEGKMSNYVVSNDHPTGNSVVGSWFAGRTQKLLPPGNAIPSGEQCNHGRKITQTTRDVHGEFVRYDTIECQSWSEQAWDFGYPFALGFTAGFTTATSLVSFCCCVFGFRRYIPRIGN